MIKRFSSIRFKCSNHCRCVPVSCYSEMCLIFKCQCCSISTRRSSMIIAYVWFSTLYVNDRPFGLSLCKINTIERVLRKCWCIKFDVSMIAAHAIIWYRYNYMVTSHFPFKILKIRLNFSIYIKYFRRLFVEKSS